MNWLGIIHAVRRITDKVEEDIVFRLSHNGEGFAKLQFLLRLLFLSLFVANIEKIRLSLIKMYFRANHFIAIRQDIIRTECRTSLNIKFNRRFLAKTSRVDKFVAVRVLSIRRTNLLTICLVGLCVLNFFPRNVALQVIVNVLFPFKIGRLFVRQQNPAPALYKFAQEFFRRFVHCVYLRKNDIFVRAVAQN